MFFAGFFFLFVRFVPLHSLDTCTCTIRIWDINICRPLAFNTGLGAWHRGGGGQVAARLSLSRKTFSYEMRFVMKVELQNGASLAEAPHTFSIFMCRKVYTHTQKHTHSHTRLHAM